MTEEDINDAGYGRCYICLKLDGKWPCPEKDIMSLCHDCGLNYCDECFHTDDHIMCTPEDEWKKTWIEVWESTKSKRNK